MDIKVLCIIGMIVTSMALGYMIGKMKSQKAFDTLYDSLPKGRTIYLGEFNDHQCNEIVEYVFNYANKVGVKMAYSDRPEDDSSEP